MVQNARSRVNEISLPLGELEVSHCVNGDAILGQ